jgi:autotransporter translocation and assembly factor TamB
MTGSFRRPRVEGTFSGEDLRAWDTLWGSGSGHIVVEDGYVTISDSIVRHGRSEIRADGLFSLGYPRRDGGQEIDARFRVAGRDVDGLRHAFGIDDYPLSGELTGEFHLTGAYERPFGFGTMTISSGQAWGEPFDTASASLRFDGAGVRLDKIALAGLGGGVMTGAAYVGWDSTYSFNADARRIPVDRVAAFDLRQIQPTGSIEFTAGGSGTFEAPRYDVKFRISDLAVKNEPVGHVTGTLALRGKELSGEIDAASPQVTITGTGRVALTPGAEAELSFRFHESSLDLPARLFFPTLSPLTTAVASGSVRVVGDLADVDRLLVESTMDKVEMRLLDYAIRNAAPVKLALDNNVLRIGDLRLVGEDTRLTIEGGIALRDQTIALKASGDANLAILQGFFRENLAASGRAELAAAIDGPLYQPVFSGSATISDGRVRHFSLPNSLDDINGVIRFDSRGVGLDELTGTLGGGRVQFGGRIAFEGYLPGELNASVRGEGLQVRYPEGVRSIVDTDLTIRGSFKAPAVGGSLTVRSALWNRRIDPTGGLFELGGNRAAAPGPGEPAASTVPVRLDVEVHVPSTLRIENNLARLVASADLQLRGTLDRPVLFGSAGVDRGEVTFEGRRYLVTKGAIEFTNPTRIEPFFDIEAETRVRVPGQTYRVVVRAAGTMAHLVPELESDPPLPAADVLALLFSDVRRDAGDIELRARQTQYQNERQQDILVTRATQMLANPISSEVGRVVEQAFGVDSFQVAPSLVDPYNQSTTPYRVNPSARVTIGKRVSERVYLTYSRSVSSSINDQILLLEYDESDRVSWLLSRNEDSTYAIEVRVRHAF